MTRPEGDAMDPEPLRILIVDDCIDSATILRILLKREGYATRIERDGPSAVAAAEEFRPDVALLDLTLPGLSGLDVAAAVRRSPITAACRIVGVSGHAESILPEGSPFDRYFQKPLDFAGLMAYVAAGSGTAAPPSGGVGTA